MLARLTNLSDRKPRGGHTLLEMLVVTGLVTAAFAVALPAIGTARQSAAKTTCQTHARYISNAALAYSRNFNGRMVGDRRVPAYTLDSRGNRVPSSSYWSKWTVDAPSLVPLSWLADLGPYIDDRRHLDCPIVNDHRKASYIEEEDRFAWDTDYTINRFGLNTSVDSADEPSRAVLFGEPNMPRATLTILPELVAWWMWWRNNEDRRADLEQLQAGSLSFSFVDGHATRVKVPKIDLPFLAAYPELSLSSGSPPQGATLSQFNNYLWWRTDQVDNPTTDPVPHFPPANNLVR